MLERYLTQYANTPLFIGLSGGLDSVYLLQQLVSLGVSERLTAIHVNHGLSPNALSWQQFCAQLCQKLGVAFVAHQVQLDKAAGNIEMQAREARYGCFRQTVAVGGVLFTAHHQDDQIETFFLRLMRGAGVDGLAAMAVQSQRDHYTLVRPLLGVTKQFIQVKACELKLRWINDESNQDDHFDRNYLRNQILPSIEKRWPSYRKNMMRTIGHMQHASEYISDSLMAELDHRLTHEGALKIPGMTDLKPDEQLGLIRLWLLQQKVPATQAQLEQIVSAVVFAQDDAIPCVQLGNMTVRRFKTAIFLLPMLDEIGELPAQIDSDQRYDIEGIGVVSFSKVPSDGRNFALSASCFPLTMTMRQANEMMQPCNRQGSRDLKRLLQEYRVEPWWRDRVPLWRNAQNELVAVGDLFVNEGFQAAKGELGYKVIWQKPRN